MNKLKVFISSVQKEFSNERSQLAHYLRDDALLNTFFIPYLFEEVAASTNSPNNVYFEEVKQSDIYIGILGLEYGFEDKEGISPTEKEYDYAKAENIPRWIFIRGDSSLERHHKENTFISKVGEDVSRKRFNGINALKREVYNSCVLFLKQTGKIASEDFDLSLHPYASLDDISSEKIKSFVQIARAKRNFPLKEIATVKQVLIQLNLFRAGQLSNSALLAFSDKPQKFFPAATIKCAHFHGKVVEKPIPDFKEFSGTVFAMASDAVDFVLSKISLSTGTREESIHVSTVYEIPRRVIAEAIINAVAHRDYTSKGSVQVAVFKNRVEVTNPGGLPVELNLESLKKPHSSYPHNSLLAGCMFLTGDIERFGTGIPEIYELTADQGLETPVFSVDEGFKVILWRPSANNAHDTAHDTVHDTAHDKIYLQLENLAHRLVWIIQNEMGREQIMNILGLRHRTNFKENYLNPALNNKWVEMTIPEKPRSKKQKYRLTKEGQLLRKELLKK